MRENTAIEDDKEAYSKIIAGALSRLIRFNFDCSDELAELEELIYEKAFKNAYSHLTTRDGVLEIYIAPAAESDVGERISLERVILDGCREGEAVCSDVKARLNLLINEVSKIEKEYE